MSDTMLIGVLRMPDDMFWSDEPLSRLQHNSRRFEAADELEKRADKIAELELKIAALESGRDYLSGEYEILQKKNDELEQQLAAEREARIRYENKLFAIGAMSEPPCFVCGYNGEGYFNAQKHSCAERHHRNQSTKCKRIAQGMKMIPLPNNCIRSTKLPNYAICMDRNSKFFGWKMVENHTYGTWTSVAKLLPDELLKLNSIPEFSDYREQISELL